MITNILGSRRRRQSGNDQQQQQSRMVKSDAQLYRDLAQASGGQAIEVTKSDLPNATSIITESSSPSLVSTKCSHFSKHKKKLCSVVSPVLFMFLGDPSAGGQESRKDRKFHLHS